MTTEETTGAPAAGWWPSPWSSAQVAAGKVARAGLQADGGRVAWVESRPDEGGRQVVVAVDPVGGGDATPVDLSPADVSVRSRVHEYGGGAATVSGGVLFYVDQEDQAWYRTGPDPDAVPHRLAGTGGAAARHADGRVTADGRWLVSVEERVDGASATHRLVAAPIDGAGPARVLVEDGHFVAAPRPSPDGRWLAWCTWDHPDMSWDASTLRLAPLETAGGVPTVGPRRTVAGGPGVAVGQPRWASDGALLFVDDRTGWWVPYRLAPDVLAGGGSAATALVDVAAEFHGPDWVFGQHTFDELADGSLVARMGAGGRDWLVVLRRPATAPDGGAWAIEEVDQPCVSLAGVVSPDGVDAVVVGTTATESAVVLEVALDGTRPARRLSPPPGVPVPEARTSRAEARVAATPTHGVPGLFFPPTNPDVTPDPRRPPPLVVFCHGGPTAAAQPGYDPVVQFLTSRGIAVASVDYRGSTGFGRAYRDALQGAWGEADVDDCVAFARSLAAAGLVDGGRMAIRGTSAGGLTALAALVRSRAFAGAVAWYGVTDLAALATDTHDFESRYLDGLVGPLPGAAAAYRDRSPLHRTADLVGRVLLLQGADDPIVPLDQAERFAAELRSRGSGCELLVFPGESHGFRSASTIEAALDAELGFYRTLFAPDGDDRG
jgi:dipeptidyl aminopeptidase/acylaminoacyl peptidase